MKTIALVVAVAVFAFSVAEEEDKRTKVLNFLKCISCADVPSPQEEFLTCFELKPEKHKKVSRQCRENVLPDVTEPHDTFEMFCKNDTVREELFNCLWTNQHLNKDMDDSEMAQWKEYVKCAKRVNKKFCLKDKQD